jgi:hypothetical protein
MTTPWVEDPDLESAEYESDTEGLFGDSDVDSDFESDFDTEDYDAESRASQARRKRARARRVALARRRQATARARSVARQPARQPSVPSAQRATAAAARAVRNLDLETKVQEDTFRSAITAQNKRMSRGEYAAVAGAAINQFIETFKAPENAFAQAALRFSPLLLLAPQRRGRGVEGLIKDPRVIGGAAVAALVLFGENRNQNKKVREITVFGPDTIAKTAVVTLVADVLDGNRKPLTSEKVTWASLDTTLATIDPNTGALTAANKAGAVAITATAGDVVGKKFLTVV